ncbi:primosomal protein N' [Aerococcaceae bacterium DSM 111020]|nr:primosomal protein N' [Aerococcaceae bacterium DSM 111020]
MIAQIIIDIPAAQVNRTFDYIVPEPMQAVIELGMRVEVPFGRRQLLGFVVGFSDESDFSGKLKPITRLLDYHSFLNAELIELSDYFSQKLHVFRITMLQAMLPSLLRVKYRSVFNILDAARFQSATSLPVQEGGYDKEALEELLSVDQIKSLLNHEIIHLDYTVEDQKTVKKVTYIFPIHSLQAYQELSTTIPQRNKRQLAIIEGLIQMLEAGQSEMPLTEFAEKTDSTVASVRQYQDKGWFELQEKEKYRDPLKDTHTTKTEPKSLYPDQLIAFDAVAQAMNQHEDTVFLLEGVTGSGKTEVYLQLMAHAQTQGKSAILLIPEIALTPQMVRQVQGRFQEGIAVLHSGLSATERYDEWRRILKGEATIVVGARSSIFAPVKNLGLIIIDEEHETTYKQSDNPRYHARDIAKWRSEYHQAPLLLGSATPSLESRARAEVGAYQHLTMSERANQSALPPVEIVDMTTQLAQTTTDELSPQLKEAIQKRLAKKEQVILLLNRRGYANYLLCRECGNVIQCPRCDISLTYHKHEQQLKCHYCNYFTAVPQQCPSCGSPHLRQQGLGTQKLTETVQALYPEATILRMDNDTTRRKGQHEQLLSRFASGEADILIGTQMIAKGLDFENVTLVGVVNADTALNIPDFRASEKTFQLLTQVSGRAGRGELQGEVIIQTYNPDHYAIHLAKNHDYEQFFYYEMKRRHLANYPPYFFTTLINVHSEKRARAYQKVYEIKAEFNTIEEDQSVLVLGPSQGGIARINNAYHFQLLIKYKKPEIIQDILDKILIKAQEEAKDKVYVSIDNEPQYFI